MSQKRLDLLYELLEYCSHQQQIGRLPCFTTLERICINQERGALFSQMNNETPPTEVRLYKCPAHLEDKLRFITKKIIDKNLTTQ